MKRRSLYNRFVLTGILCLVVSALLGMWRGRLEAEHNPPTLKSLGLKLKGTVVSGCQGPNVAIIERFQTQEIYHEGDRLGEAQIQRILRNKAIIRIGSREELLCTEFEKNATNAPVVQLPGQDRQQSAANTNASICLDRAEIVSSFEDLHQLMKQIRIHCYQEREKPTGFLVSSIKPDSLFAKMGLHNGDIIMGMNDEPVASVQQGMDFYKTFVDGRAIALQIQRRGRPQTLRFEVR